MVRLIVDDAGNRRAFNVGEGTLTVGSGSEAKLKLGAHGVASVHVEIEVHGNKATLHPKPGVTAPHVLGRAATASVVLQHGVPVKIGGATVTVEYEGLPSKVAPAAAPAPVRGSVARRRGGEEQDGERPRRAPKRGVPIWVWIASGVPVVVLLAWIALSQMSKDTRMLHASANAYYQNALDRFKAAQFPEAKAQLELIPKDARMDPGLAKRVQELADDIDKRIVEGEEYARNELEGTRYFDSQLKGFVDRYMSGQVTSPEARVFLQRAEYFRKHWPKHSQQEWVARQEARFKGAIDLGKPPGYEDLAFQVESLTWASPRNYREALAAIEAFQKTASGDDVQKTAALLADVLKKREAWFVDRKEQARWHYERKEEGKAVGILLSLIRYSGDEAMADWGAKELLNFGDMETWLRGYRRDQPEGFAEISRNRLIADFLKTHPL